MTSVGLSDALTLLTVLRQLVELMDVEKLTLRGASPHGKALDVVAVPYGLQHLAYQSPTSVIHLVSPNQQYVHVGRTSLTFANLLHITRSSFQQHAYHRQRVHITKGCVPLLITLGFRK